MRDSLSRRILRLVLFGFVTLALLLAAIGSLNFRQEHLRVKKTVAALILEKVASGSEQELLSLLARSSEGGVLGEQLHFASMLEDYAEVQATLDSLRSDLLWEEQFEALRAGIILGRSGKVLASVGPAEILSQRLPDGLSLLGDSRSLGFARDLSYENEVYGRLQIALDEAVFRSIPKGLEKELEQSGFEDLKSFLLFPEEAPDIESPDRKSYHFQFLADSPFQGFLLGFTTSQSSLLRPVLINLGMSLALGLLLGMLFFGISSSRLMRWLIQPLKTLKTGADALKEGNLQTRIELDSEDELGELALTFNQMSESILHSQEKLQEMNENLELQVRDKTASIQSLLDNAGQGFLSFGADFLINEEISEQCHRIFGEEFQPGDAIDEWLFEGGKERSDFREWLSNAFTGDIDFEVLVELSPQRMERKDSTYDLEYRRLVVHGETQVMLILTDVTEQLILERRVREEQAFARMILRVLEFRDEFIEFIRSLEALTEQLQSFELKKIDIAEFFRHVHTLKGQAGSFEVQKILDVLHVLESQLQDLREGKPVSEGTIRDYAPRLAVEVEAIKKRLEEQLKGVIDWDAGTITVGKSLVLKAVERLKDLDQSLYREFVQYLKRPLKSMLTQYAVAAVNMAERFGKELHEVQILGDDLDVQPERIRSLIRALVHVVRNSLDHGIESPEEREALEKDPAGSLFIRIFCNQEQLSLEFEDDGRGIDAAKIRKIAVQKGLIEEDEANRLSDEEAIQLIFEPGFSTSEEISDTSGRGVGMDAVQSAASELGGRAMVYTELGMGTRTVITIPFRQMEWEPEEV